MNVDNDSGLTGRVIGASIAVHRELGPGLDEPVYERMLSTQLRAQAIPHSCQAPLPLRYKGVKLDCGYRIDVLVEERLVVEVKSVEVLLPIHEAQLLTYLQIASRELGLLINFDVPVLKHGVRRRVRSLHRSRRGTEQLKRRSHHTDVSRSSQYRGKSLRPPWRFIKHWDPGCCVARTRNLFVTNYHSGD